MYRHSFQATNTGNMYRHSFQATNTGNMYRHSFQVIFSGTLTRIFYAQDTDSKNAFARSKSGETLAYFPRLLNSTIS